MNGIYFCLTQAVNELGDRTNTSSFCRIRVTNFIRAKLSGDSGVNCSLRVMINLRKRKFIQFKREKFVFTGVKIGSSISCFIVRTDSGN